MVVCRSARLFVQRTCEASRTRKQLRHLVGGLFEKVESSQFGRTVSMKLLYLGIKRNKYTALRILKLGIVLVEW